MIFEAHKRLRDALKKLPSRGRLKKLHELDDRSKELVSEEDLKFIRSVLVDHAHRHPRKDTELYKLQVALQEYHEILNETLRSFPEHVDVRDVPTAILNLYESLLRALAKLRIIQSKFKKIYEELSEE